MSGREETNELHVALLAFRDAWADGEVYETYPEVISSVPLDKYYRRYVMGHKEIVEGLRDTLLAYNEGWAEGAVSDGVYGTYLDSISRDLHAELLLIEKELQEEKLQIFAEIKDDE